jgi:hypothetical protein
MGGDASPHHPSGSLGILPWRRAHRQEEPFILVRASMVGLHAVLTDEHLISVVHDFR